MIIWFEGFFKVKNHENSVLPQFVAFVDAAASAAAIQKYFTTSYDNISYDIIQSTTVYLLPHAKFPLFTNKLK